MNCQYRDHIGPMYFFDRAYIVQMMILHWPYIVQIITLHSADSMADIGTKRFIIVPI